MSGVYRHLPFTRVLPYNVLTLIPAGIVVSPAGVTAASAVNAPVITVVEFPSGVTAASAENNPVGNPQGVTTGQSATSAENNPVGNPQGVPTGNSAVSGQNNPVPNPQGVPSGEALVAAENNPTTTVTQDATVTPAGVAMVAQENNPTTSGGNALGGGVAWPYELPPFSERHWTAPSIRPQYNGTVAPEGVHAYARVGRVAVSVVNGTRSAQAGAEVGRVFISIGLVALATSHGSKPLQIRTGYVKAHGQKNPTDEEFLRIILEAEEEFDLDSDLELAGRT